MPMPIVIMAKKHATMAAGAGARGQGGRRGRACRRAGLVRADRQRVPGVEPGRSVRQLLRERRKPRRERWKPSRRRPIVVLSGDMDKVFAASSWPPPRAAAGMETTMFFTFWGIKAVQNGNRTGKKLHGPDARRHESRRLERLGPSKFNFGGMGRWMFKKMMARKASPRSRVARGGAGPGVHLLACKMSMDVMEIRREDLIPEVEDVVGAAKAIKEASASQINYFI